MITFLPDDVEVNVTQIVEILRRGGLVVAPTDTSYGILVDATNRRAVEKLLKLKMRPVGKAISIFVNGWPMMDQYVDTSLLPDHTKELLPGSYTLVLPSLGKVSELIEAEDKTLGVRYINSNLINRIVDVLGSPVTATSANVSGKSPAYSTQAFISQLSNTRVALIDAIIDAGDTPHNPPSTVISFAGTKPHVIRANTQNYIYHKLYRSHDIQETGEVAGEVFQLIKSEFGNKSIVILLDGELGSGKTTWTKYFARCLGISGIVSPTYTFECEYPVKVEGLGVKLLRHFDLYNINRSEDIASLKLERCLEKDSLNVVEWPAQLGEGMLEAFAKGTMLIRVHFEYLDELTREITVYHN